MTPSAGRSERSSRPDHQQGGGREPWAALPAHRGSDCRLSPARPSVAFPSFDQWARRYHGAAEASDAARAPRRTVLIAQSVTDDDGLTGLDNLRVSLRIAGHRYLPVREI